MKLTNYNRGYIDKFDCAIHGTIYMNTTEYLKAIKYLRKSRVLKDNSYFWKEIFEEDLKREIRTKNMILVNVRVTATEQLARHYKLNNYKKGNYMIAMLRKGIK